MQRYYWIWLHAVVLTALSSASLQSQLDERRILKEQKQRLSNLADDITASFTADYRAGKFRRLEKSAKKLQSQGIQSLGVCAYSSTGSWQSEKSRRLLGASRRFDSLCKSGAPHLLALIAGIQKPGMIPSREATWTTSAEALYQAHLQLFPDTRSRPATRASFMKSGYLTLLIAHDLSPIRKIWLENMIRTSLITAFLCAAVLLLVGAQISQWLAHQRTSLFQLFRALFTGQPPVRARAEPYPVFIELPPSSVPAPENIENRELIVIANREPFIHERNADSSSPRIVRPASGLVSALEPVLRQHGGLWIAHGSGSADFESSDTNGEIAVPPDNPRYVLKRVKLSAEAEMGYYYGFSNEGLWPLCHLAHMRPIFRLSDWNYYCAVADRFTEAVPQKNIEDGSLILVQDYHFALVPRKLRRRAGASKPRIGLFWHIPWPNPETFGICPWGKELLEGMLGADVVGFHTQYHCNNFLETCNRYLEARIDWERFSVTMDGRETLVRAFPIGIDTSPIRVLSPSEKDALKKRHKITAGIIALGVDRLDYTKGLIERVESVERFLEKRPEHIGQFTLLQIGSPSRTQIAAYQRFTDQLVKRINEVNARFSIPTQPDYKPILFLSQHHDWNEIQAFYQLGNICMVTSLHDGMNLVAKEYVWCQDPTLGSLILSKFTGASRELTEAFIVNPYNIEEMADAIEAAIVLSPDARSSRMLSMKEKVFKQNAYQWASDQIQALLKTGEGPPSNAAAKKESSPRFESIVKAREIA